jgi:ribosomal protein L40E
MHEDVKICPECGAEYFAHVEKCNDCGVRLLHPEEKAKMEEEAGAEEPVSEGADEQFLCVEEGGLSRVTELAKALESAGIGSEVVRGEGPGKSCSMRGKFSLLVPKPLVDRALKAIEDYWHRLHPEVKQAKDRLGKGVCPCCGSEVAGLPVCPDCGLVLEGPPGDEDA